jgi:hypothetical protein
MLTEVYLATYIPPLVPEFVDSHITCEDDGTFLFEIDPNHHFIVKLRESGEVVKDVLENTFDFRGVKFIYSGESPDYNSFYADDIDWGYLPTKKSKSKKKKFWQL